jgi:hypothetical protein
LPLRRSDNHMTPQMQGTPAMNKDEAWSSCRSFSFLTGARSAEEPASYHLVILSAVTTASKTPHNTIL